MFRETNRGRIWRSKPATLPSASTQTHTYLTHSFGSCRLPRLFFVPLQPLLYHLLEDVSDTICLLDM